MSRLFALAGFALCFASGIPEAHAVTTPPETAEDHDDEDDERPPVKLQFEIAAVGYQGNWTRQQFVEPADATVRVQRHGGELVGGVFNVGVRRKGWATTYHSENGRAGFLFGRTPRPTLNGAAGMKPVPRHGFNFGLFSDFRENAGVAVGGVCGVALSGVAGESIKAFTRSTVPGNHMEFGAGAAMGLQCAPKHTFMLVQYAVEGNLGVEQMQDLTVQQGNRRYQQSEGNGLLLYGEHGPTVLLVHDSEVIHAAFSGQFMRSIGRGRWGGKRTSVRGMLALAFGEKTAFGIAPWYRLDVIEYGEASKVVDNNTRWGHTLGVSFVAARAHPSRR
ncbi:MAG: hypothetical protein AAF721_34140 [Myxococcota bacterium]